MIKDILCLSISKVQNTFFGVEQKGKFTVNDI